jgi:putative nucleotidyltransferase with HDIG domain
MSESDDPAGATKELAIENGRLKTDLSNLERSYDLTLELMGHALDNKNAENEGHCKRVTAFSIAIAQTMGLPREKIMVIARGVFLHDIGKMAIPDAILRKPGKLLDDEQRVLRQHAHYGYQMLKNIPILVEASEIVYSHHERFDGTGYPRGLKGETIPLGARIFAVADTLDAITSDHPFSFPRILREARGEIEKCSGSQFDPEVVKVFLDIPEKIWSDLRNEIDGWQPTGLGPDGS